MVESCITFLPVKDIETTTRFYTQIIGLSVWKDIGKCRIFDCGRGFFGFCQYGDGREIPRSVCLSLNMKNTAEVDEKYRQLLTVNAPVACVPQKQPGFPVYSFFVKDPDGYLVEFQKILL